MTREYRRVKLPADALRVLAEHYDGLRFTQVTVSWIDFLDDSGEYGDVDDDNLHVAINVSGPTEVLRRHGFLARGWTSLPPCGVRLHRTKGFGHATVKRRNGGGLLVHGSYDDGLDKLAPALVGPLLERFVRPPLV